MGPVANVIGLPSVKYVAKVPPIAPATTEVPGANVRDELVKESVPVAEKNPLMESAWATAALLTARAATSTARRLSMGNLRRLWNPRKNSSLSVRRCPANLLRLAGDPKK
jgi:hypothetical protein